MDEQKNMYEKKEPGLKDCWVKFALLILALFLGSYLATYFIIDQTRHSYYINPMRENEYMNKYYDEALWDKDFKRDFDEIDSKMNHKKHLFKHHQIVETFNTNNAIKLIIDLRPFGNKIENVKVNIDDNKISVSGQNDKKLVEGEKEFFYSQSFTINDKIKKDEITNKKIGHKYIITIPLCDNNIINKE